MAKQIENLLRPIEPSTLTSFLERQPIYFLRLYLHLKFHALTSCHDILARDRQGPASIGIYRKTRSQDPTLVVVHKKLYRQRRMLLLL
ncbi:hypothetical protein PILCRDRAFT_812210 [Piloderma croceum F 1598]|uniref:Uncharacterized protein n=1 Tax=Piloderma croceum (strain F 1598) TaxID=765440 RepID=A0A0C3G265_PILCF|nr:hypothetical protein PILCRDRAFT_812210 [Piloderma croceum F 1598]